MLVRSIALFYLAVLAFSANGEIYQHYFFAYGDIDAGSGYEGDITGDGWGTIDTVSGELSISLDLHYSADPLMNHQTTQTFSLDVYDPTNILFGVNSCVGTGLIDCIAPVAPTALHGWTTTGLSGNSDGPIYLDLSLGGPGSGLEMILNITGACATDQGDCEYEGPHIIIPTYSNVPIPAAAWLFGSALIGLAGIKRKK